MRYISGLIIIGFVGVAIFGFAGFISDNNSFVICVNNLTGSSCAVGDSFLLALSHIQTYLNFVLTILTFQALFIFLFLVGVTIMFFQKIKQVIVSQNGFFKKIYFKFVQNRHGVRRWFALLEKHDHLTVIV